MPEVCAPCHKSPRATTANGSSCGQQGRMAQGCTQRSGWKLLNKSSFSLEGKQEGADASWWSLSQLTCLSQSEIKGLAEMSQSTQSQSHRVLGFLKFFLYPEAFCCFCLDFWSYPGFFNPDFSSNSAKPLEGSIQIGPAQTFWGMDNGFLTSSVQPKKPSSLTPSH